MTSTTLRRIGALLALAGLVLTLAAFTTGTPAGAAPVSSPICNNQKPDQANCVDGDRHGTLTTEVQADGTLVLTVAGDAGFGGWSGVKICIPGEPMTTSADCTGADKGDTLVPPSQYTVSGVDGLAAADDSDAGYTFDCDASFSMLVDEVALDGDPTPSYTVHLSPCAGGTDEAFGTAEAFVAPTSSTTEGTTTTTTLTPTTTTTLAPTTTTTLAPTTTTTLATTTTTTLAPTTTTMAVTTPTTASMGGTAAGNGDVADSTVEPLAVLGALTVRPGAPSAAAVTLARTGTSTTTSAMLPVGLLLLLFGSVLVFVTNWRTLQPARVRPRGAVARPGRRPLRR